MLICTAISRYALLYPDMHCYIQICTARSEYALLYPDMHRYIQICTAISNVRESVAFDAFHAKKLLTETTN